MPRQKVTEEHILQLVRTHMEPLRLDAKCTGCVLRNVRRRPHPTPGDSNWIPGDAGVGSPDCERELHAFVGLLMDRYDVVFKA